MTLDLQKVTTNQLIQVITMATGGVQVLTGWNNRVLTGILGFPKGPPTPFTS